MPYRSLQLPRLQLPVQSRSIAAKSPIFCLQTQILSWDPEKEGILLVHMGPAVDTGSHHVLSDHHHRKLVLCGVYHDYVDVQFHECYKLLHKVLWVELLNLSSWLSPHFLTDSRWRREELASPASISTCPVHAVPVRQSWRGVALGFGGLLLENKQETDVSCWLSTILVLCWTVLIWGSETKAHHVSEKKKRRRITREN